MTDRQPSGTPVGGQFAEGRKPEGNDLSQTPEMIVVMPSADGERAVESPSMRCHDCDGVMTIGDDGISNHRDDDGNIDYDTDLNHVAFTLEDSEDDEDDEPEEMSDDFPISLEYDTSYEDGDYQ